MTTTTMAKLTSNHLYSLLNTTSDMTTPTPESLLSLLNSTSTNTSNTNSVTTTTTAITAWRPDNTATMFVYYLTQRVGPFVLAFGILTNLLTLLTLMQPRLKEAPYSYLTALAAADLSALILIFISTFISNDLTQCFQVLRCYYIVYIYYPFTNIASVAGVWIIVVLTIERFLLIQFPLWAPIKCTLTSARVKIFLIFIVSILINFPRFLWYKVVEVDVANSSSIHQVWRHLHGTNFSFIVTWIHSSLINFLPLVLLVIFNSLLIYKVYQQQMQQNKLGIHNISGTVWSQEQFRFTLTLIGIVCMFIILVLPSAFADEHIALLIFGTHRSDNVRSGIYILQHVSNFLIWLNLSLNFLMYSFINHKFRRAFKHMIEQWISYLQYCLCFACGCCCQKQRWLQIQKWKSRGFSSRQSSFNSSLRTTRLDRSSNLSVTNMSLRRLTDRSSVNGTSSPIRIPLRSSGSTSTNGSLPRRSDTPSSPDSRKPLLSTSNFTDSRDSSGFADLKGLQSTVGLNIPPSLRRENSNQTDLSLSPLNFEDDNVFDNLITS